MFFQESLKTAAEMGVFSSIEQTIFAAAQWLRLGVEAVGAIVIGIGAVSAIFQFIAYFRNKKPNNFNRVRLTLGKHLTLALEFQLGADILSTAIAPSWEQIGKLAVIAAIRTVLNYFLTREIAGEQKREEEMRKAENDSI